MSKEAIEALFRQIHLQEPLGKRLTPKTNGDETQAKRWHHKWYEQYPCGD